ncbi:MAG TPA: neuraminidase-like domain-containing protein, partial [Candidatus Acidoferrales bacterium]|nr:neuraminidase-like domain-containing protein [Candidatus Acidoferrales bacterium]
LTIDNITGTPPSKTWNGVIVIPHGGNYRFVVSIAGTGASKNDFKLTIDDGTPATANVPANPVPVTPPPNSPPATVFAYDAITFKGGAVFNVTFTYTGSSQVSLLWQIDNADPVLVPSNVVLPTKLSAPLKAAPSNASPPAAQLVPVAPPEYLKLFKATRMVTGLSLTKAELHYLISVQSLPATPPNPQALAFSLDRLPVLATDPDVSWTAMAAAIDLLGLNRSIAFKSKTLFELWGDIPVPTIDDVANQTGWKVEDIAAVQTLWTAASPPLPLPPFNDPKIWYVLRATMDIVNRLDLRAQKILDLLVRAEPTPQSSVAIRNAFRAQFTAAEWKDVFKPLMDPLRQLQRDALVGFLTTRPVLYNGKLSTFFDADDLYGYFLIDTQMETDTLISRIVLAHLVVQLFVDRVFLGLEDPASFVDIDDAKDQWAWMQRFRVWEANRKVFLFPENYIEPELRDDKTEFFQELEDELLQGNISDDTGNTALANYLDKMNEVSNLQIVGAYAEGGGAAGTNFTLHVVGRTRFESHTFYYRSFIGKQVSEGTWNPWIKIPIDIKADVVAPVIFNGRLHLYWPSVTVKERADPPKKDDNSGAPLTITGDNVADEHHTTYMAEIKLMSTEYIASQNKWLKPILSKSRSIDGDAPTPFENAVGEIQPATDNYHLRIADVGKEYVSIDLIKTHTPQPNIDIDITGILNFFGRGNARVPRTHIFIERDQISPARLGTFKYWYTGQDTLETPADPTSAVLQLGKNWPVSTALVHNGAVQVDIAVEGQTLSKELELNGNVPFFQNTPQPFRVFDTNFGYLGTENAPFFYETSTESLFAVNKGLVTEAGFTSKKILAAQFTTFNHPLVRQLQQTLHDYGTPALMNRLT